MYERAEEIGSAIHIFTHLHGYIEVLGAGIAGRFKNDLVATLYTNVHVLAMVKYPTGEVAALQLNRYVSFHQRPIFRVLILDTGSSPTLF